MPEGNYNIKGDRRESKRKTQETKWVKHSYGENWKNKITGNISKYEKKLIKEKLKIIINGK